MADDFGADFDQLLPSLVTDQCSKFCDSANVSFGSRLCENVGTETTCATIEFLRKRGRIIVAAQASFVNHYFVLAAENLFLHSLGQVRTIGTAILSVRTWGYSGQDPAKCRHCD